MTVSVDASPTLPPGWRQTTLGSFISLQRGFDLPARVRRPGPFPVLSSGGYAGFHDQGPIKGPGLVIGRATNLGVPTWSDGDFWPLNTTLFVKDFCGNDPRFVYYLLQTMDLSGYNSGSVQPMLNRNYVAKVSVVAPTRAEQETISSTLRALDDKIESIRRVLDRMGTLLDLLAQRAAKQLPSVRLADLATASRESAVPLALGGTLVDHYSLPAFDATGFPERVAGFSILSNKLVVDRSAILVSRLNPRTNRTWFAVPDSSTPGMASTEFMVLTPVPQIRLGALWLAVRDEYFRAELARRATGTSGSHQRVRPEDALSIEVPDVRLLPPGDDAEAEQLMDLGHQRRVEGRRLAALRDALLPELVSGRIRVPEAREAVEDAAG